MITTLDASQLLRLSPWHVESVGNNRALAQKITAQSRLPIAFHCSGSGTVLSDGKFFPVTRRGEAMTLINAEFWIVPCSMIGWRASRLAASILY